MMQRKNKINVRGKNISNVSILKKKIEVLFDFFKKY